MKRLIRNSVFASAIAITGVNVTPLLASPLPQYQSAQRDKDQDQNRDRDQAKDHDCDQDRDHDRAMADNDSAYYNNRYYKQGWKDGMHHKHKDKKWKNDNDRMAYEAGYSHGDRGEKWQKPHQDNDRH